jgi:hypothetical protein
MQYTVDSVRQMLLALPLSVQEIQDVIRLLSSYDISYPSDLFSACQLLYYHGRDNDVRLLVQAYVEATHDVPGAVEAILRVEGKESSCQVP